MSNFKSVNHRARTAVITIPVYHEDTDDVVDTDFTVAVNVVVCTRCDGRGSIVNPSVDGHGLGREDFEDEDFAEAYWGGHFDICCPTCHGNNIEYVIDEERTDPKALQEIYDYWEGMRLHRAEVEAEKRFGA